MDTNSLNLYYLGAENSIGKHIFCGGWVGGPVQFIGRLSPLVFSSKEMWFCLYPARTRSALLHPEFCCLAGWWGWESDREGLSQMVQGGWIPEGGCASFSVLEYMVERI